MRLFFATILMAFMASNAASASSFVVLDGLTTPTSPSIIILGESPSSMAAAKAPETGAHPSIERFGGLAPEERKFVTVSPSVIAMVDAPQPVAFENVASIGDEQASRRLRGSLPMVIRGGIVGDAFGTAPAAPSSGGAASSEPQQQVSAPTSGAEEPASAPNQPGAPEDDRMPKSALPPPAPPTGRME